jgi:hypothetical protein
MTGTCLTWSLVAAGVIGLAPAVAQCEGQVADSRPSRQPGGGRCPCSECWIVNARQAPACDDLVNGFDRLTYWKYEGRRGSTRFSREEFIAAMDPSLPTLIYIHGSFLDHKGAVHSGWKFFRQLGAAAPPFRLVVWSWPAERIPRMNARDNFRVKMVRSEKQGYYLAALVDQIDPDVPLSLLGHSLGCRTVCAGLEGLAGREVAGVRLSPPKCTSRPPIPAVLLVPAFDPRYLWPEGRYGLALDQSEQLLIVYNPHDRLLGAHARVISPWVLGRNGMPQPERLGENGLKLLEVNSQSWIHHGHIFSRYARSPQALAWIRRYLFWPIGDN